MEETNAETKQEKTYTQAEVEALIEKTKTELQEPSEFDKRLNGFMNSSTFGNIGRRLEILRRDDPDFYRALITSAPNRPGLFFGRASHASLAMILKKEAPELYKQARARAVQLGLLAADPLREDDALHGKIRFQ